MDRQNDPWMMNDCKLLWHMDRVNAWERGARITPILIDIGITQCCQIKCKWCFGVYQKMDNQSMIPQDVLVRLFSEAPLLGIKAITLTGNGEPTLNPGVWQAMEAGKRHGLDIGIATNAIAIDNEHKVNCVVDNCLWTRITIGGYDKDSYINVHQVDKFDKVLTNIQALIKAKADRKSRVTLGMQSVLIPEYKDNIIKQAQLAIDLGLDYLVIKQFSNCPHSGIPAATGFDVDKFIAECTPILKEAEAMSTPKTKIIPKWTLIHTKNRRMYPYCIDLPFIFQVSGNGKCYPCGYLFNNDEYCYGDLNKQTILEIIRSEQYWDVINKIRQIPTEKLCAQGSCRHDLTNLFLWNYINKPPHISHV